mmetsp:Transcript_9287/g.12273  ORF Transcript_9287/g.12273 Transcript_9287/m.12273 type:complete len:224 (-) Transcript_9287:1234-1905(-)
MFSPLLSTMVSLARPVINKSPVAGLIIPKSPVSKKPSLSMAFKVASGLFMYSDMIWGPFANTNPAWPFGSSTPVSTSTILMVVCGGGIPTDPTKLCSQTLLEITGEVSVKPYPTTTRSPTISKKSSRAEGREEPPDTMHLMLPPKPSRIFDQTSLSATNWTGKSAAMTKRAQSFSKMLGADERTTRPRAVLRALVYSILTAVNTATSFCLKGVCDLKFCWTPL